MDAAPQVCNRASAHLRNREPWWPGIFHVVFSEYARALAAEQRYRELKHAGPKSIGDRPVLTDIPRQIFEEFYATASAGEGRLPQPRATSAAAGDAAAARRSSAPINSSAA
jgi:hypothetical protein